MADFFKWDPGRLALNIDAMDREHQQLISHMNEVHALHEAAAQRSAVARAVGDLVSYTKKHFADEEAYLRKIGYAELKIHCIIHQQLLDRMDQFVKAFEQGGELGQDFFRFLKHWLSAHICGIDMKYAQAARQPSVKALRTDA